MGLDGGGVQALERDDFVLNRISIHESVDM
jgi:hypothetical protein